MESEEYCSSIMPKKAATTVHDAARRGFHQNSATGVKDSIVMYVDMNSYFASCEQQAHPELRNKPVGVLTYDSPNAAVIAASIEAKSMGVKTGMRLGDCKVLCPDIICVTTHPAWYRKIHVDVMAILRKYCDDVMAKSIDEASMNFTSYTKVLTDFKSIAENIKKDIAAQYDYLKCSIGIAPNSFLAKLGTELQKPDGLIQINPENIDGYLATLKLTDLPGIASANERRLKMIGINTPLEMRHASEALLRKAFGGVVGNYWHRRLNFAEVDIYSNEQRTMSATRTVSRAQSANRQTLESLFIALCTRLEQRMVKNKIFCKEVSFFIRYHDRTGWDTKVKLTQPVQDALEIRQYLAERIHEYETSHNIPVLFNANTMQLGVGIQNFVSDKILQYSLFDNRIKHDVVRKVMYDIKDRFDKKNIVRKGSEMLTLGVMKDAIGFGSVRDLSTPTGDIVNEFLLEEDDY